MKNVRKKTPEDHAKEVTFKSIKVSDTGYFFWVCDICMIAYFADDEIIVSSNDENLCPNIVTGILGRKKPCHAHITRGDEACFNKYYKIK